MTPSAIRAMRGALDWSMRDLAEHSSLGLGTVLRAEQGEDMTPWTKRRLRDAFRLAGVQCSMTPSAAVVTIGPAPSAVKGGVSPKLLGLRFVAVRRRASGSYRVAFEVPAKSRPPGWPPSRPLPSTGRTGRLDDAEVQAIRRDARKLLVELERARAKASRAWGQRNAIENSISAMTFGSLASQGGKRPIALSSA